MPRLLLLLVLLTACGQPSESLRWEAGRSLLDEPLQGELAAGVGALALLTGAGERAALDLDPSDWVRQGVAPDTFPGRQSGDGLLLVFEARPVARLILGGARPVLIHAGVELERLRVPGVPSVWRDPTTGSLFWWRSEEGLLLAASASAPGDVRLASPIATATDPTRTSNELALRRVASPQGTRAGLLLPSPASLRWPAAAVTASALTVALQRQPRMLGRDERDRLVQGAAGEGRVRAELVAWADERRVSLADRVLGPADPEFVELTLDLSPLQGQSAAFELVLSNLTDTGGLTPSVALADGTFTGAAPDLPSPRGHRPHVLLLSLDTLRADRLGCYGSERDTSPALDDWSARHAQRFEHAMSDSNWTLPSTATLLTGLSTRQHGLLAFPAALGEHTPTLARTLRAAGYGTLAITEGGFVSPVFGMDEGFERFLVQPAQQGDWSPALQLLDQRGDDQPLFVFLHTYRAHSPWAQDDRFADAEAPYAGPLAKLDLTDDVLGALARGDIPAGEAEQREVNRRYDAAVRRLDAFVGAFLQGLDARVPARDRLVIITSDHGEHLFQHGHIAHGHSLFDAVLRVPLLISWPGGEPRAVSLAPAAGVDVVPTVLQVLGLPTPEFMPGRGLQAATAASVLRVSQHADQAHAVERAGWKLVTAKHGAESDGGMARALFQRTSDPGETRNLLEHEPERAAQLARALAAWQAAHPPAQVTEVAEAELDTELLATLRELGYLGADDDGDR